MAYSLSDVVWDGPRLEPRWLHHLDKLQLHSTITGLLVCLFAAFWGGLDHVVMAGVLGGPVLFMAIKIFWPPNMIAALIDGSFAWTWNHLCDFCNDGSMSTIPLALTYLAARRFEAAGITLALSVLAWVVCHTRARP